MVDEINQIENSLKTASDSPGDLAEYLTKLAGWYSYRMEQAKKIALVKPSIWLQLKVLNKSSDKVTDMTWEASEDGQKEIALDFELKRITKMYSSIDKRLRALETEFRISKSQI